MQGRELEVRRLQVVEAFPNEWVGGQLHIEPPDGATAGPKTYVITVPVVDELHEITVSQGGAA